MLLSVYRLCFTCLSACMPTDVLACLELPAYLVGLVV